MSKRGVVLHWNGPPATCVGRPHTRCEAFWAAVKRYHGQTFGSKWAATSLYSFGICPHGTRFEGCGWNRNQAANGTDQVGANDGRDSEWYTVIVFLGEGEQPTSPMILGVQALIQQGRDTGRCGLRVLPHNAFKRKTCPGPEFTALARDWDNRPFGSAVVTPEEDVMSADPRGAARLAMREYLGRSPNDYAELDFHAGQIRALSLNGYIEWLETQDEAVKWAAKIGAEVRAPDRD